LTCRLDPIAEEHVMELEIPYEYHQNHAVQRQRAAYY
jgi:hypothetical protein